MPAPWQTPPRPSAPPSIPPAPRACGRCWPRAAAAAKRLQRDGRLLGAAHGELSFSRDLTGALLAAFAAFAALVLMVTYQTYKGFRRLWLRLRGGDDRHDDLVDLSSNWTSL
jgi:hypothetical protein